MPILKSFKKSKKFPFTPQEITKLLFLEQANKENDCDKKTVNELVELYTKLVQFYDTKKDPIKGYFMDKMQTSIFRFNRIEEEDPTERLMERLKVERVVTESRDRNFNILEKIHKAEEFQSTEQFLEQRRLKRGFELRLSKQMEAGELNISTAVNKELAKVNKEHEKNSKVVHQQLSDQDDNIHKKIARRRQSSIVKSLRSSFTETIGDLSACSKKMNKRDSRVTSAEDGDSDDQPELFSIYASGGWKA